MVSCENCYLCNPNLNFVNVMLTDSSMFELKLKPPGPECDSSTQRKYDFKLNFHHASTMLSLQSYNCK